MLLRSSLIALTISLQLVSVVAVPANDECAGAIGIGLGDDLVGTTVGADYDSGVYGLASSCGYPNTAPGVWYTYTASAGGTVVADSCVNRGWESRITLFTGSSCGALSCVDSSFTPPNGDACELAWEAVAGETYYILVNGVARGMGHIPRGGFNIKMLEYSARESLLPDPPVPVAVPETVVVPSPPPPAPTPPPNDLCKSATTAQFGVAVDGRTSNAAAWDSDDSYAYSVSSSCPVPNTAPGVWYSFTFSGADGELQASACNDDFAAKVTIFTGTCDGLACVDPVTFTNPCSVAWDAVDGTTYLILVNGVANGLGDWETGGFALEVSDYVAPAPVPPTETVIPPYVNNFVSGPPPGKPPVPPPAPANDMCLNAADIVLDSPVIGNTRHATHDGGIVYTTAHGCGYPNTAPGVWYRISSSSETSLQADACQENFRAKVAVFTAGETMSPPCDLSCAAVEGGGGCAVTWGADAGGTYLVLVNGDVNGPGDWETGSFELTVKEV